MKRQILAGLTKKQRLALKKMPRRIAKFYKVGKIRVITLTKAS